MSSAPLRFVCDQNVDAAVSRALKAAGYQSWTAHEAGLADASDDDLAVYAHKRNAVLISADREFSQRRSRNIIGRHIWLHCDDVSAAEVLMHSLPDFAEVLLRHQDLYVAVSQAGYRVTYK